MSFAHIHSDGVLLLDVDLSKEWLLGESNPKLAVHLTLRWPVHVLEQALGALLHQLLQVVGQLASLIWRCVGAEQAQLVQEECLV